MRRTAATGLLLTGAALLAGCAVGPDYHRPAPPAGAGYGPASQAARTAAAEAPGGEAQNLVPGQDIPARWWELFQSPELNALIGDALKRNADLQAARSGMRAAMENLAAQRGAFLPSIAAGGSAARNRNAAEPSPFLASDQLLYNLYEGQLNASWTIDLFGGTRRAVEAARALAEAQRFQLESTTLALTANVAAAAIQEASLREQIAATRDGVDEARQTLDIVRRELALGAVAEADVAAQEAALAQAEQALPPLEKQLAQERDLIAALSGRLPSEAVPETFDLSKLHLPAEVPVSLPSRLVEQRPDIRMAEANLHAACAEVGVAIADMLPDITLTANPGTIATSSRGLFQSGNGFWSLGAGVTQPIFQGGALLDKAKAARASYEQAAAQYRSTVLTAFQNVADTLYALESDADLLKAAATSERAAAASFAIARRQLELGDISTLGLLSSEQAYQQARVALAQARAARLADTAALFQALGGGWWNRSDLTQAK